MVICHICPYYNRQCLCLGAPDVQLLSLATPCSSGGCWLGVSVYGSGNTQMCLGQKTDNVR